MQFSFRFVCKAAYIHACEYHRIMLKLMTLEQTDPGWQTTIKLVRRKLQFCDHNAKQ